MNHVLSVLAVLIGIASSGFKTQSTCLTMYRVKEDSFSYETEQAGMISVVVNDKTPPDYRIIIPSERWYNAEHISKVKFTNDGFEHDEAPYPNCPFNHGMDDPDAQMVDGAKVMIFKDIEGCPVQDFFCMDIKYNSNKKTKTSSELKHDEEWGVVDSDEESDNTEETEENTEQ